jgi:hypothetical protein
LFLDSIIFFSDFFASRSTPHPMIILYFFPHPSIHSTSSSHSILALSLESSFYVFFSSFLLSFFFSFHSNENHLNIIVIFFLLPTKSFFLLLQLLQPPTTLPTFLFYFHFLLYIAFATADTPRPQKATHSTLFTFSHTIHIIHKMDGFFSFFFFYSIFTMNDRRITADVLAVVVMEFMGSYLLFLLFLLVYRTCDI